MKKLFVILILIFAISACKKELRYSDNQILVQAENQSKKSSPPQNANPAFAFRGYNYISKTDPVPSLYVMDVNGANVTLVYTNYVVQKGIVTYQYPNYPSWNNDGSKLCFTLNNADIYTLNISLVNGIASGSNATKIGDGVAAGGNYKQGKWRPGQNQVASVFKKTGDPDKINLISTSGGLPTVLYTASSTDWVIEDDIAFKSDGSRFVFSERQVSTGYIYLKVLDVSNGYVIKSIDMSQFSTIVKATRIVELDWAKTYGSDIVALTTRPQCDESVIGLNGIHQLFTIDIGAASPILTWIKDDVGVISFSPNDTQMKINSGLGRIHGGTYPCSISSYYGAMIFTFATQAYSFFPVIQGGYNDVDWKR